MNGIWIYPAGNSAALRYAGEELTERGLSVVESPSPDVTHLLLPVPSFEADGRIRFGGILEHILGKLSESVTVIGGNLHHPALRTYRTVDLMEDPIYVAKNAAVTAECAIGVAMNNLSTVLYGCPVLVIGWGRIGKCLAAKLKALGAEVTVAARKPTDRAMLSVLGYNAEDTATLKYSLIRYRVIFNTVPERVLPAEKAAHCRSDCLKIELASTDGIEAAGVIKARGLPGKEAPEASGQLIAEAVLRALAGKELLS